MKTIYVIYWQKPKYALAYSNKYRNTPKAKNMQSASFIRLLLVGKWIAHLYFKQLGIHEQFMSKPHNNPMSCWHTMKQQPSINRNFVRKHTNKSAWAGMGMIDLIIKEEYISNKLSWTVFIVQYNLFHDDMILKFYERSFKTPPQDPTSSISIYN